MERAANDKPMDAITAWVTKHWVPLAVVCVAVGVAKVLRGLAKGEIPTWKEVLSRLASTLIGGMLGLFVAKGLNLNDWAAFASIALGCHMGVELYWIGEADIRERYKRRRRGDF